MTDVGQAGDAGPGAVPTGIDWRVAISGALVGAAISLPAGIVARLAGERSALSYLAALVIFVGLASGGYAAAQRRLDLALAHGALAGLLAYVGVQAIGVVTSLARGETLRPLGYPLLALLATSCGVIGAFVASARARRSGLEV